LFPAILTYEDQRLRAEGAVSEFFKKSRLIVGKGGYLFAALAIVANLLD
jgi:hypothetical protein